MTETLVHCDKIWMKGFYSPPAQIKKQCSKACAGSGMDYGLGRWAHTVRGFKNLRLCSLRLSKETESRGEWTTWAQLNGYFSYLTKYDQACFLFSLSKIHIDFILECIKKCTTWVIPAYVQVYGIKWHFSCVCLCSGPGRQCSCANRRVHTNTLDNTSIKSLRRESKLTRSHAFKILADVHIFTASQIQQKSCSGLIPNASVPNER